MPFDGMEVRESCEDRPICPAERTSSTLPAAAARPSKPFMCSRRVMDVRLYGNRSAHAVQNDVDNYSRACALRTACGASFSIAQCPSAWASDRSTSISLLFELHTMLEQRVDKG